MIIADRLKQRRLQYGKEAGLDNGYTQDAIAAAIGVTQGFYSRCESNHERLGWSSMLLLAAFYGKPLEEAFPEFRPTPMERRIMEAARR